MAQLSQVLANDFGSTIKQRGEDYFHSGRVNVQTGSRWYVSATVRGTAHYRVELRREDPMLSASCTCPYFDIKPCKHVWAVLLAADEQRLLLGKGGSRRRPLYLVSRDMDEAHLDTSDDLDGVEAPPDETDHAATEDAVAPPGTMEASDTPGIQDDQAAEGSESSWRNQLARVHPQDMLRSEDNLPARTLLYVVDAEPKSSTPGLKVSVLSRIPRRDGTLGQPKPRALQPEWVDHLPDPEDRRIIELLTGARQPELAPLDSYGRSTLSKLSPDFELTGSQPELIVPALCRTGRCRLRLHPDDNHRRWRSLSFQNGAPWQFRLTIRASRQAEHYEVTGGLHRGDDDMSVTEPQMLAPAGILCHDDQAAQFSYQGSFDWIVLLREQKKLYVPTEQREEFLGELLARNDLPALDLPDELRFEQVTVQPRPCLAIRQPDSEHSYARLSGELSFEYDGSVVTSGPPVRAIVQSARQRVLIRDQDAERIAEEHLHQLGWRRTASSAPRSTSASVFELPRSRLVPTVRELLPSGWRVSTDGNAYRSPEQLDLRISSGVDWFELHGDVSFNGKAAPLPALLQAVRRGEDTIQLTDGTVGVLPEEWLGQYGALAALGTAHEDHVRFGRSQAGLLDALLASQPQIHCDELFSEVRRRLASFDGIKARNPPSGFHGELRPYQKEGLGWLHFLGELGFGGCLADDMGLGKTVQVLALLESLREERELAGAKPTPRTSLVVAPKSLIFNWQQEAARFAPRLRVLDHTGPARHRAQDQLTDYDLVLTTYGTLRNDVTRLRNLRFNHVILDEAQVIKNPQSLAAKAVRLLQADHRLALTGTPIENHLGELWSLFEFLNPGMLGAAAVFKLAGPTARNPDDETRRLLAHALRPFLLRRTKGQVMSDLPPKLEQTLYCELGKKQRKLYDELRNHYRTTLLRRIDNKGLGGASIQILEALMRLRQAAIHPGLIDTERRREASAKLDMLMSQLHETLDEGHKVLVFSQFTAMLSILRDRLDSHGINYEYLDGRTRDREAHVTRFQTDPDCQLFLISLKAGGVGLNLTAAQYVFLLDPWWNPAVEAQAIDRAHRIGQTQRVFAYRLIARDTIEEKVLKLQQTKRDLAAAIISANNSLVRDLSREDLELLLS